MTNLTFFDTFHLRLKRVMKNLFIFQTDKTLDKRTYLFSGRKTFIPCPSNSVINKGCGQISNSPSSSFIRIRTNLIHSFPNYPKYQNSQREFEKITEMQISSSIEDIDDSMLGLLKLPLIFDKRLEILSDYTHEPLLKLLNHSVAFFISFTYIRKNRAI